MAAENGDAPEDYRAWRAPRGSVHDGVWYLEERDGDKIMIDDCVWMVLPDGRVTRAIPVGNPISPPSDLDLG